MEIEIELKKCYSSSVIVKYNYFYESGYVNDESGNGLPPSEEIDITNIEIIDGNLMDILVSYNKCQDIIDEIEERISEYERDKS